MATTFIAKSRLARDLAVTMDALVCAYLAAFYWTWGGEKAEMIGDIETGYIINPAVAL